MIKSLGYITTYLLIGIALLPLPMTLDKLLSSLLVYEGSRLIMFVVLWPLVNVVAVLGIWIIGWAEFLNYI